jgi:uncharacterized protein YdaU (DUF1376 family)
MHYYQFNIGDYASHAGHLTEMEDLGFRRLLDLYYLSESPLPNDMNKLCRLIRMRNFEAEIGVILGEFFDLEGDSWHNKRADEEIARYQSKADTARANGAKGGRPKGTTKPRITQPVILANPEKPTLQPDRKLNNKQEPLTINQEPVKENTSSSPKADPIPYQQIVDSYNDNLPMLRRCIKVTDKVRNTIRKSWNADKRHQNMEFWDRYFVAIPRLSNRLDFWTGVDGGNKQGIDLIARKDIFERTVEELVNLQR